LFRTVASLTAVGVSALFLFLPSCQTKACDGTLEIFGDKPGQGQFVDSDTWQSNPSGDLWLPFPAQRTWLLLPPGVVGPGGRRLKYPLIYISPNINPNRIPGPNEFGDNFTLATGNVAEVTYRTDAVFVHNDTCADYYVRIVLALEPNASVPDAGTDGEVDGSIDGSPDGAVDASPDALDQ
jgi:hypothetical protein